MACNSYEEAARLTERALALMDAGSFSESRQCCLEALKIEALFGPALLLFRNLRFHAPQLFSADDPGLDECLLRSLMHLWSPDSQDAADAEKKSREWCDDVISRPDASGPALWLSGLWLEIVATGEHEESECDTAMAVLKRSVEKNCSRGMNDLASLYHRRGDDVAAEKLWADSTALGHTGAKHRLGLLMSRDVKTPEGRERAKRGVELVKEAAGEGHAAALRTLAHFHLPKRSGQLPDVQESRTESERLLLLAADQGDGQALCELASNVIGSRAPDRHSRAYRLFERAWKLGCPSAALPIALMNMSGIAGVPKDPSMVATMLLRAARCGWAGVSTYAANALLRRDMFADEEMPGIERGAEKALRLLRNAAKTEQTAALALSELLSRGWRGALGCEIMQDVRQAVAVCPDIRSEFETEAEEPFQ